MAEDFNELDDEKETIFTSEKNMSNCLDPNVVVKLEPLEEDYESSIELSIQMAMSNALYGNHCGINKDGIFANKIRNRYRSLNTLDTPICEVCQSEFSHHSLLSLHKLCHFNTRHVCYVCDSYFAQSDNMILHMLTTHRDLNNFIDERESLTCPVCLQHFAGKQSHKQHQYKHKLLDANDFSCHICNINFSNPASLSSHLIDERHLKMKVDFQGMFVCVECHSVFSTRDTYAMHMMLRAQNETCRGLSSHNNAYESSLFEEKSENLVLNLSSNEHDLEMDKEPPEKSERNTSIDRLTMVREKMHTCKQCFARFPTQDALAMHIMMHVRSEHYQDGSSILSLRPKSAPTGTLSNNQFSWKCQYCDKIFSSCDALAMHVMSHAQKSPLTNESLMLQPEYSFSKNSKTLPVLNTSYGYNGPRTITSPSSTSDTNFVTTNHEKNTSKRSSSVDLGPSKKLCLTDQGGISWECWECKEIFDTQTLWLEHIFNCSRLKLITHRCEECKQVFADLTSLQEHMKETGHLFDKTENIIKCLCGWNGTDKMSYRLHIKTCVVISQKNFSNSSSYPVNKNMLVEENSRNDVTESYVHKENETLDLIGGCASKDNLVDQNDDIPISKSTDKPVAGAVSQSGIMENEDGEDQSGEIIDFVLSHANDLLMCKHCNIVYLDKTMYYLHMGLHNLNNPWQCNMCGKVCTDKHQFTSHVIHY